MLWLNNNNFVDIVALNYLWDYIILIIIAIMSVLPLKYKIKKTKVMEILYILYISSILIIALSFVISGTYSPFIYFNF